MQNFVIALKAFFPTVAKHRRYLLSLCIVALVTQASDVLAQKLIARVDAKSGLPEVLIGGVPVIKMNWVFWGSKWDWAGLDTSVVLQEPLNFTLTGRSPKLGLDVTGTTSSATSGKISINLAFNARQAKEDVIGGGLAVFFSVSEFASILGEPEILPDKRGIAWGKIGGNRIEWKFDSPVAAIFKERGSSGEIRIMFYAGRIDPGNKQFNSVLSTFGEFKVEQSLHEKFGAHETKDWPVSQLGPARAGPDLSFLNEPERPAGKRGFVQARGDRLFFADGTKARFWGTNVTASAIFSSSPDSVRLAAKRMSGLGFNLVRLHHHDSVWLSPNVFGTKASSTLALDEAAMEKYDWWVKCLKDEGIYVWVDLHVGRAFTAADKLEAFEEIAKGKTQAEVKGQNYINASVKDAFKVYNDQFFSRLNKYTGVKYADEPAITAYMLTNENDVVHHFGNAFLADKNVPKHFAMMKKEADAFAAKWSLAPDRVMRTWEHGPSKLFLSDLEHRFNEELIGQLKTLGVRVPIVTTNFWGDEPLSALAPLSDGDMIDAHSYGRPGMLEVDSAFGATPLHWLALARVQGKPFTVSEWNTEPFPGPDRHVLPLVMAAKGSHQSWSALMQYAYTQFPLNSGSNASIWEAINDPSLIVSMTASALMFRRGDVREAAVQYVFSPTPAQLFGTGVFPQRARALREASEVAGLSIVLPRTKELPWMQSLPPAASANSVFKALLDADIPLSTEVGVRHALELSSDTRELKRNWDAGYYQIDTPRSQVLSGWIRQTDLSAMKLTSIEVSSGLRNASIAVQSLSELPIAESESILVSIATQSLAKNEYRLPYSVEPFKGLIKVKAKPWLVASYTGHVTPQFLSLNVKYEKGWYSIPIEAKHAAAWIFLKRP